MVTQIFVNLPVKDLKKSMAFFSALGFTFNQQFTDDNAACMIISDTIFAMLLTEAHFKRFTKKELSDAEKTTEAILALAVENRQQVDDMVQKAIAAGGTTPNEKQDYGWMYGHGFQDLDGHLWEVLYVDAAAVPGQPGT